MSATLTEAAARGIGSLRIGGHAIPGQGRVVDSLGKFAGWLGGGVGLASPRPGLKFEADLTDRIQRQMWAGTYEPHVRECFEALLQPGDRYFDVGAHIGYHAVSAAFHVGAAGRVFAFEADPGLHQRLSRNLAQFPWAQAVHGAVWDHSGTLTFERSSFEHESGWGTLCAVRDMGKGEHVTVPSIALDDWCREQSVSRWDAMKLDAEGSELAVLQGARESIAHYSPSIILEINGIMLDQAGSSSAAVVGFLGDAGYKLFSINLRKLQRWDEGKDSGFSDTLCLPESRSSQILQRLKSAGFEIEA
jgi:FkbM family methyltransferase